MGGWRWGGGGRVWGEGGRRLACTSGEAARNIWQAGLLGGRSAVKAALLPQPLVPLRKLCRAGLQGSLNSLLQRSCVLLRPFVRSQFPPSQTRRTGRLAALPVEPCLPAPPPPQLDPKDLSEQLKRQGASIPGIRPGRATAEYITKTLDRMSVLGEGRGEGRALKAGPGRPAVQTNANKTACWCIRGPGAGTASLPKEVRRTSAVCSGLVALCLPTHPVLDHPQLRAPPTLPSAGSVFLGALAAAPALVESLTGLQAFRGFAGTSVLILVGGVPADGTSVCILRFGMTRWHHGAQPAKPTPLLGGAGGRGHRHGAPLPLRVGHAKVPRHRQAVRRPQAMTGAAARWAATGCAGLRQLGPRTLPCWCGPVKWADL